VHTTFLLKGLKKRQPLRSFRHRSNDDIKMVLRFIGSENDRSVLLAYSMILWRNFANRYRFHGTIKFLVRLYNYQPFTEDLILWSNLVTVIIRSLARPFH